MGNRDNRSFVFGERPEQQFLAPEVDVIGRLVEQQQVGSRSAERLPEQQQFQLLTAAQGVARLRPLLLRETMVVEPGAQFAFGTMGRIAAHDELPDGPGTGKRRILLVEQQRAQRLRPAAGTARREQFPGQQTQQRGLPGPVAAPDPEAFAGKKLQRERFGPQHPVAEADVHAFERREQPAVAPFGRMQVH